MTAAIPNCVSFIKRTRHSQWLKYPRLVHLTPVDLLGWRWNGYIYCKRWDEEDDDDDDDNDDAV